MNKEWHCVVKLRIMIKQFCTFKPLTLQQKIKRKNRRGGGQTTEKGRGAGGNENEK